MKVSDENHSETPFPDPPKVLSDIFESLIGAIYVDSGGKLRVLWDIYKRFTLMY